MLYDLPVAKWLFALFVLLHISVCHAQFVEVTGVHNIVVNSVDPTFGSGCSFADFNMDGWPDLSVTRDGQSPKFYQNNEGSFTEASMGIPNWGSTDQKSILWADYDNDGDRDLLISPNFQPVRLYRNDGNLEALVNVTEEAGIASQSVRNYGASWVDYDRDGFLDLYICKYHNATFDQGYQFTNHLYRNLGDGTFEDMTLVAGVGDGVKASFQSLFFDYNNDGWPDLYVINDRINVANSLYMNNGDGTFTDVSVESGTNIYIDAMCGNAGDFDHDGDLDVYVTNSLAGHQFLINNGDGTFTDQAVETGTYLEDIGWGSIWIDYQNNTWQDLFVSSVGNQGTTEFQNRFFLNLGNGTFIDYAEEVNIDGDMDATYSVAMADFDRDGWVDYFTHNAEQSSSSLWKNVSFNSSLNNWLAIDLQGTVSNRDAVGTWLEVYAGGEMQIRYTTCGYNYISQDSFTQHFGLGEAFVADSVIIKWPSGLQENYYEIPSNMFYTFVEGATLTATINQSGTLNLCHGDSITLYLQEGLSCEWSNGVQADTLVADTSGMYFASYTSPEGFELVSDTLFLSVLSPIEAEATTTDVVCNGQNNGTAQLEVNGSLPPYDLEWNGLDPQNLIAGMHEVHIVDSAGCELTTWVQINEPDPITIDILNEQIFGEDCETAEYNNGTVDAMGGTSPFEVEWTFASPEFTESIVVEDMAYSCIPNVEELTFTLAVVDNNGCTIDTSGTLEFFVGLDEIQPASLSVFPNPASTSCVVSGDDIETLALYDMRGKCVYESVNARKENKIVIPLHQLDDGIYLIRIQQGQHISSIPIVVQDP